MELAPNSLEPVTDSAKPSRTKTLEEEIDAPKAIGGRMLEDEVEPPTIVGQITPSGIPEGS